MTVRTLHSAALGIAYGQFYIVPDEDSFHEDASDMTQAFKKQSNGICGAAVSGHVIFITGIQNGKISIDVQLCDSCPEQDNSYQEIVETSFNVLTLPVFLSEWGAVEIHNLDLPKGSYRLRYSIDGMDKDYDVETEDDTDEYWESPLPGQRHLIQLWIAELSEDLIVKQTTEKAKYWHKELGGG